MSVRHRVVAALITASLVGGGVAQGQEFQPGDVFASVGFGIVMIYRVDPATGLYSPIPVNLLNTQTSLPTTGSGFDAEGNFYVTTFADQTTNGAIVRFARNYDPAVHGLPVTIPTGGTAPESLIFDATGRLYVGHARPPADQIARLTAAGAPDAAFDADAEGFGPDAQEPHGTDWIDLASDQRTVFYTSEGRRIKRYDTVALQQLADFAALPEEQGTCGVPLGRRDATLFALRVLANGGVLVADNINVKRLDATGAVIQTYDMPDHDCWFSLNLDPDGASFWSGDTHTGQIHKFDISTGAHLDLVDTGFADTLYGVAVFKEITQAQQPPPPPAPTRCESRVAVLDITVKQCAPFELEAWLKCGDKRVPGRVASFTVNGVPVGQGLSDENGFFHGLWSVPLPAGMGPGFYPETIVGTFAGDDEYTPSVGSGDIRVVACAPPPPVVKPPAKKPARPHKKPAKKKW